MFSMKISILYAFIFFIRCTVNGTTADRSFINCPSPRPPENTIIAQVLRSSSNIFNSDYLEHDKVYFQCKDGYSNIDINSLMYATCASNGKWFPPTDILGKCVLDHQISQCRDGFFRCRKSRSCIEKHKKCNCEQDCEDGSDEENCLERRRYYFVPSRGKDSNGIITSPGFPKSYPKNFSCTYYFNTMKNHHVELFFEEFQLPNRSFNECTDYLSIGMVQTKTKRFPMGEKICGHDLYFKFLHSNKTRIVIKVDLGTNSVKLNNKDRVPKGYSFTWRVRYNELVKNHLNMLGEKFPTTKKTIPNNENLYTIITPVAITFVLSILLIAFLYYYKKTKTKNNKKEENKTENNLFKKQSLIEEHLDKTYFAIVKKNGLLRNSLIGNHNKKNNLKSTKNEKCNLPQQSFFVKQPLCNSNDVSRSNSEMSSEDMRYVQCYDLQTNHYYSVVVTPQLNFSAPSSTDSLNKSTHCWCNQNPPTRLLPVGQEYGELDMQHMFPDFEQYNKCYSDINYPMGSEENIAFAELYKMYNPNICGKHNFENLKNSIDNSSTLLDYNNRQKRFNFDTKFLAHDCSDCSNFLASNCADAKNFNNLKYSQRTFVCNGHTTNHCL
ncbi:uncharacterized protein LOC101234383 [Hydra vulgaris]|uniref:uncharacterized protein LOC101234383 n=1 Tax=Hydra vulgaris TaxID=6087 RepID=UPI0006413407|nr:uncharacterized protein LOC101234383 [Hydra vulgaris]XP_047126578.1 uncharacterized protein LOC101234383 [Hydra vulgaris]